MAFGSYQAMIKKSKNSRAISDISIINKAI
jgi:hypothetical protein